MMLLWCLGCCPTEDDAVPCPRQQRLRLILGTHHAPVAAMSAATVAGCASDDGIWIEPLLSRHSWLRFDGTTSSVGSDVVPTTRSIRDFLDERGRFVPPDSGDAGTTLSA